MSRRILLLLSTAVLLVLPARAQAQVRRTDVCKEVLVERGLWHDGPVA